MACKRVEVDSSYKVSASKHPSQKHICGSALRALKPQPASILGILCILSWEVLSFRVLKVKKSFTRLRNLVTTPKRIEPQIASVS